MTQVIDRLDFVDGGHHQTHLYGTDLSSLVWGATKDKPAPIAVTQDFGYYNAANAVEYAYAADQGWPAGTHVGIDIGLAEGTPVYAAEDGTVTESHADGSIAPYFRPRPVEVTTAGGYLDIYGHLGKDAVQPGQKVHAGQLLGWSDQQTMAGSLVPDGSGAHLHFERRDPNGNAVNPVPTLLSNPVSSAIAGPAGVVSAGVDIVTGAGGDAASAALNAILGPIVSFAPRLGLFLLGALLLAGGIALAFPQQTGAAFKTAAKVAAV